MEEASQREPSVWRAAEIPDACEELIQAGIDSELAPLLARRGVATAAQAQEFLQPELDQLHDPFQLDGMDRAVDLLLGRIEAKDTIAVVGDYDVDGVTSAAIMLASIEALGGTTLSITPHRIEDGYGLQLAQVDRACGEGATMILALDCGATAHEPVSAALERGLAVVVADHHLAEQPLPENAVHLNPHLPASGYPFRDLSAAGVAFKLATALFLRAGRPVPLAALLRPCCLGTIADVVPLRGENRVLASHGLRSLAETRSPGLLALFDEAGLRAPFSATDVGYRIGPRINAAGRIESASVALELLLTRSCARGKELAQQLGDWNRQRQELESEVVVAAFEQVRGMDPLPPFIVLWAEGWHRGVVGIAASRVMQRFHRPALLLSVDGDEATGSGRSISEIDLHAFLDRWNDRYLRFGGHRAAVGMTVASNSLESLAKLWQDDAKSWSDRLQRVHNYEMTLTADDVGRSRLDQIQQLEPFGAANPPPLLRINGLNRFGTPRAFGNGHIQIVAAGDSGRRVSIVAWGMATELADPPARFDVLAHLEWDDFVGGPRLRLTDLKPAVS